MQNNTTAIDNINLEKDDIELFLHRNSSEKQKKIIKLLSDLEMQDKVQIYKAICYLLIKTNIPCRQMMLAHLVRELFNSITRRDTDYIQNMVIGILEQGCKERGLEINVDTIKKNPKSHFTSELYGAIHNEKVKIHAYICENRPFLDQKTVEHKVDEVRQAKGILEKARHFNGTLVDYDEVQFKNNVEIIENFILLLEPNFYDNKNRLDDMLESNSYDITILQKILDNKLSYYFFSNLKVVDIIENLLNTNLLHPKKLTNIQSSTYWAWPAKRYFETIINEAPGEVTSFVISLLKKNNKYMLKSIFDDIFSILSKLNDDNYKQLKQATTHIIDLLNSSSIYLTYYHLDSIKSFISTIEKTSDEDLLKKLLTTLLHITPQKQKDEIFANEEYFPTDIFGDSTQEESYKNLVEYLTATLIDKEYMLIFDVSCDIFDKMLQQYSLSEVDKDALLRKIHFNRPAIEEHSQNEYSSYATHHLINLLRDSGESIFRKNNSENKKYVIKRLNTPDNSIYQRVLLHLLRLCPKGQKRLIGTYLKNKELYLDKSALSYLLHHEYYLLFAQEFSNLPNQDQTTILKNFKIEHKLKDSQWNDAQKDNWLYTKLYWIKDNLEGDYLTLYQGLSSRFTNSHHPDFLSYFTSSDSEIAELKNLDFEKKSMDDILIYLLNAPNNTLTEYAEINVIKKALVDDIKNNDTKYWANVESFTKLKSTPYLATLICGLIATKSVTDSKIEILISFAQNTINEENKEHRFYSIHRAILSFIDKHILDDKIGKLEQDIHKNIQDFITYTISCDDPILEQENEYDDKKDFYHRVLNSLYGNAVEALFKYGLFLNKNEIGTNFVINTFDNLLKTPKYTELFSLLGRFLPWLHLLDSNWFTNNIKLILPEANSGIFDITWVTYVTYVKAFDDMFPVLEKQYEYALSRYKDTDNKENVKTIVHIATFYVRGVIDSNHVVIKNILDNTISAKHLFYFLGRISRPEDRLPEYIIARIKNLWQQYRQIGAEIEVLTCFDQLYNSGLYEDEWAFNELFDIMINHSVSFDFHKINNQFKDDYEREPEKALQMIEILAKKDPYFIQYRGVTTTKALFSFIKDGHDSNLKYKKDAVINEFMNQYGMLAYNEFASYLENPPEES